MANSLLQGYDLAIKAVLYSKFASILGIDTESSVEDQNINLGIFQFPKDVAKRIAAEKRGQTYLEFINFWRRGASFSWERNRSPLSKRGLWVSSQDGTTTHVKATPIDLRYDAWFWSKDLDKIYKVMEDYVFWQHEYPKVTLLYNDLYELTPDLHFGEIVDESVVAEQFEQGIEYIYRMPITLDGWVLKGDAFKIISKIKVTFYDKDDVTDYEEIIVEDSNQNTELEAALRFFSKAIYEINAVSLLDNSISIRGNFVSDFSIGQKISVWNSTNNNGNYTISSAGATYANGLTKIVVDETLVSETADGTIYVG
jgi:hypothetical protein